MTKLAKFAIAAAAAVAFSAVGYIADAQETKTTTPTTTTKKVAAPKSKCNAITDETACKADTTCLWIAALIDPTTKKQKRKAYCKTKSVPKAKTTAPTTTK